MLSKKSYLIKPYFPTHPVPLVGNFPLQEENNHLYILQKLQPLFSYRAAKGHYSLVSHEMNLVASDKGFLLNRIKENNRKYQSIPQIVTFSIISSKFYHSFVFRFVYLCSYCDDIKCSFYCGLWSKMFESHCQRQ